MNITVSWQRRIWAYSFSLPRWFALPVAVLSVLLGGILFHAEALPLALAVLSSCFMMAFAHTWNSFHDWITGFDQGSEAERSHEKPYTGGQNLIGKGIVSLRETFMVAMVYLLVSAALIAPISLLTTSWVWLPWGLAALCAPLYSWGKLSYLCELFLGLGFGPLAVMLGAAASRDFDFLRAFLAGVTFGLAFGYAAEVVDQYLDADVNLAKGLRNLGALAYQHGLGLALPLGTIIGIAILAHVGLTFGDILKSQTQWAVALLVPLVVLAQPFERRNQLAIMVGLGLICGYSLAMVLLQAA
jgi:1,4-dihydroxy-2-naphthoate octaprenyltransferase